MICEYCNSQVPDGSKFCTYCGAQLQAAGVSAMPQDATPQEQMATPAYQPYQQQQEQPYQQQQQQPYTAPSATASGMPSKGAAIALIVIGFLCGIIWGVIGIVMYSGMSKAIEAGDLATATTKFRNIAIATGIGVALNVIVILSGVLG